MNAVERLIDTAMNEVGYCEKNSNDNLDDKLANAGSQNYTKYARDLDKLGVYNFAKNGYSWCDVFVDWCFIHTFGLQIGMNMLYQPMGCLGASCTYSAYYYKSAKKYFKTPELGDQIFFNDCNGELCHTGIVVKIHDNCVYTVEGNTSSNKDVVCNGGAVASKVYRMDYDRIDGYGRPDWSTIPEEVSIDSELEQFKQLMVKYRKELQDNDANNYSEGARKWAIDNGIIIGGSDSEFNGMWEDFVTREQVITMLHRFAMRFCL